MSARDDEQALLAVFSELYDWLAGQDEHAQLGLSGSATHVTRQRNRYRLIHPEEVAGFTDANLLRLSAAFIETSGHGL
jgi:hypothetical protein